MRDETSIKLQWRWPLVGLAVVALLAVSGGEAYCKTKHKTHAAKAATAKTKDAPAESAPPANAKLRAGELPAALVTVRERAEHLYDAAKAEAWGKAAPELSALKKAAGQLPSQVEDAKAELEQLDKSTAALEQAITSKDSPAALYAANSITFLAAKMAEPFKPTVPAAITLLDYYGRELEIWSLAKESTKLSSTTAHIEETWKTLRPQVEAHNGKKTAKKFAEQVKQLQSAKTPDAYAKLVAPFLDGVDTLEKVFQ